MEVRWGDTSIRTRQLQAAVRVAVSFQEHLHSLDVSAETQSAQYKAWQKLNNLWLNLKDDGDRSPDEYCNTIRQSLEAIDGFGEDLFQKIAQDLRRSVEYDTLILRIMQQAVGEAHQCVEAWGGPKAKARARHLRPLPVHGITSDSGDTKLFFDRDQRHVELRAGAHPTLLGQSLVLHFSFFHEYLSHVIPSWTKDQEAISEGFLFAAEFSWFEARNSVFESEMLAEVWQPVLAANREPYKVGQWLLKRCVPLCVEGFFLEWVAEWETLQESLYLDLVSQFTGISKKTSSRFVDPLKEQNTQELLRKALCGGCTSKVWDLRQLGESLTRIFDPYARKGKR
jgi:hypothetical protein